MRKFLFVSCYGESLPIAWRMIQEGAECRIYIHVPASRGKYRGWVPQVGLDKIKEAVKWADMVIFDMTRSNNGTKEDMALLKVFGLPAKSESVFGPVADKIRKAKPVVGCSSWCEKIELDRYEGSRIAKEIGLAIPETHEFKSLKDGIDFLLGKTDRYVFKPHNNLDLDLTYVEHYPGELIGKLDDEFPKRVGGDRAEYILQRVVEGHEISTEAWWNGEEWTAFNHTIEDKKFMDGNLGPGVGSANNVVWLKQDDEGLLVREFMKLTPWVEKAGYIGPVDINCIVGKDGRPYFLEFSPRFGWDALYCLLSLCRDSLTTFFSNGFHANFYGGYAASVRLSIPPYPYYSKTLVAKYAKDVNIMHKIGDHPLVWWQDVQHGGEKHMICPGTDGILGVIVGLGQTIGEAVSRVYRTADKLKIGANVQYRTDLGKRAEKAIAGLKRQGISIS